MAISNALSMVIVFLFNIFVYRRGRQQRQNV
jgi:hypothetical protein